MFANSGVAYLLGITGGGLYGVRTGLAATPSNRFRVQLNSVLNHSGRYGSRAGNTLGVFALFYSFFEGIADQVRWVMVVVVVVSCVLFSMRDLHLSCFHGDSPSVVGRIVSLTLPLHRMIWKKSLVYVLFHLL